MLRMNYLFAKFMQKIQIPAIIKSDVDKTSRVCAKSHVYHSKIAAYSYIGNDCKVFSTEIGKYCSIADGCFIGGAQHPINHISTSPVFHKGKNIMGVNFAYHNDPPAKITHVENDVWIGANSLIKEGVTIANGAIVAMGSVVTHDVPAYEIWGGNPAKKIRDRFTKEVKEKLEQSQWWNMSEEKIKENAQYFNDPKTFVQNVFYEKNNIY